MRSSGEIGEIAVLVMAGWSWPVLGRSRSLVPLARRKGGLRDLDVVPVLQQHVQRERGVRHVQVRGTEQVQRPGKIDGLRNGRWLLQAQAAQGLHEADEPVHEL